jgi:ubiquinone/menaquinone biosynthesis C-methylase UbiE
MMAYSIEGLENSRATGFRPKNIFGLLLKEFLGLRDNLKILDLGCGTGFFTRILAEQCNSEIIGMDINEDLLKGARKIAKENLLEIKYETGDITDIQYEDNTFDIVMCDIMLECFKDISIPLMEMKRVCKTRGIVAAIEPFYQSSIEYYPDTDNTMRDLILKHARVDRSFGLGPMLPHFFKTVDLMNIDLIGWFWGRIENKTLEIESVQRKLKDMEDNLEKIKMYAPKSKQLTVEEQRKVIGFFQNRLEFFKREPEALFEDMSVKGLPVLIVKGYKA